MTTRARLGIFREAKKPEYNNKAPEQPSRSKKKKEKKNPSLLNGIPESKDAINGDVDRDAVKDCESAR